MNRIPPEIAYAIVSYLDRPSLEALRQTNRLLADWALPRLFNVLRFEDNDDGFGRQYRGGKIRKIEFSSMPDVVQEILPLAPWVKKLFVAPMYYEPRIWKLYEKEREQSFVYGYVDVHEDEDLYIDIRRELRGCSDEEDNYDFDNDGNDEGSLDALGEPTEIYRTEDQWETLIYDTYCEKITESRKEIFVEEMVHVREVEKKWEKAVELQNSSAESAKAAICSLVQRMRLLQSLEIKTKDTASYERQEWACEPLITYDPEFSTTTTSLDIFANALKLANGHITELILREVCSSHLKASGHILHTFRNLEKLEIHFLETNRFFESQPRTEDWAEAIGECRHTLRELTIKRLPDNHTRKMHCLQDLLGHSPKENLLPIVFPKLMRLSLTHLTTSSDFLGPFLAAQKELRFLDTEWIAFENSYSSWEEVAQIMPAKLEEWRVDTNFERRDVDYGDVVQRNISFSWRQPLHINPPDWEVPGWENELKFGIPGASMGKAIFRRKKAGNVLR